MLLLVLCVLYFLHALLFKTNRSVLYCGIFGGSFNRPIDETILDKIRVLGLFNESRGTDSCGYYNGNILVKDADKHKVFHEFVIDVGIKPNDGTNNVFIGHTRRSSIGAANLENAHPFDINDRMIMAHNGTLKNHYSLCSKHGIKTDGIFNDSRMLGLLIDKVGPKILESYEGGAALLIHKKDEPGVLYAFHGASRDFKADVEPKEERPLFFMNTPEGVYVSSLIDALKFIKKPGDKDPAAFPVNLVCLIKNGKFLKKTIPIARENANVYTYTPPAAWSGFAHSRHYDRYGGSSKADANVKRLVNNIPVIAPHSANNGSNATIGKTVNFRNCVKDSIDGYDIALELMPEEVYGVQCHDKIFYYQNRHYIFKRSGPNELCHGPIVLDKTGKRHLLVDGDDDLKKRIHYFWQGVYLEDLAAYTTVSTAMADPDKSDLGRKLSRMNFAKYISKYAKYPVVNIGKERTECTMVSYSDIFYKEEALASACIQPAWSNRHYHFKNGRLIAVKSTNEKDTRFFRSAPTQQGASAVQTRLPIGTQQLPEHGPARINSVGTSNASNANADGYGVEFQSLKNKFCTVYSCYEDLELDFTATFAFSALWLYFEDVLRTSMKMSIEGQEAEICTLMEELWNRAVEEGACISELMDTQLGTVDYYLAKAIRTGWEAGYTESIGENDDDPITEAEIVEEIVHQNGNTEDENQQEAEHHQNPFPQMPLISALL